MSMPLATNSIHTFLQDFSGPKVVECRCSLCHCIANTRQTSRIMVPAPYLAFHKVGAGDVALEENIKVMKVNIV